MGSAEGGRRPPLAKRLGCPHPPLGREKKGGVQRGAAPPKEAIVKEKTFFQKIEIFSKKLLTSFTPYIIIIYVSVDGDEGTPVPFSNTVVKLIYVENT